MSDNVSSDSQIDFIISVNSDNMDDASSLDDSADVGNAVADDMSEGTGPATTSAAATATTSAAVITSTAASATGGAEAPTSGADGPMAAVPYATLGIAPGDGDLMPPKFADDRQTDAEDWLQDFLDYIRIRQVPKPTGLILLRNRLTGAARKWMQSLPASADFDDTIRRFRARFTHNAERRDELMDTIWNRRQGADEPVSTYIEDMVGIARRMQLDNEPLMRQGIIQGLRPEIRRDVRVLRPTNLEELAEAAAIGEANAKLMYTRTRAADAAVSAQLAEMREMMASMQVMMSTQNANTVNAPPQHPPRTTTTTTATATHYQQNVAATAATSAPAPSVPQNMTVQLVMPEPIAAQYGGGRGGPGGRGGRGRGRGWRGPWRGPPPNRRPVDATARRSRTTPASRLPERQQTTSPVRHATDVDEPMLPVTV